MPKENEIPTIGYTIEEAAQALRVHHSTVRTLVTSGEIKAVKAGKSWLIHPDAIREWMMAGTPKNTKSISGPQKGWFKSANKELPPNDNDID